MSAAVDPDATGFEQLSARRYIRQRKPFTFEFTAAWIAMKRRPPHSHSIVAGGLPEMDDFSAKPGEPNMYGLVEGENNAIAPGKRPLSSMAPTIVTDGGKPLLVVGTPGGSHIPTAVLQTIVNLIDYRMTLTEAVNAPRIHAQWLPDTLYHESDALSADTRAALAARGHRLEEMGYWNQVAAILVGGPAIGKPPRGRNRLYGAIDPRLPVGSVAGY